MLITTPEAYKDAENLRLYLVGRGVTDCAVTLPQGEKLFPEREKSTMLLSDLSVFLKHNPEWHPEIKDLTVEAPYSERNPFARIDRNGEVHILSYATMKKGLCWLLITRFPDWAPRFRWEYLMDKTDELKSLMVEPRFKYRREQPSGRADFALWKEMLFEKQADRNDPMQSEIYRKDPSQFPHHEDLLIVTKVLWNLCRHELQLPNRNPFL